jgi:hypothetical protein
MRVVKSQMEGSSAIVAALLVLFATMMDSHTSVGIGTTLLAALGIYRFAERQKQETWYVDSQLI